MKFLFLFLLLIQISSKNLLSETKGVLTIEKLPDSEHFIDEGKGAAVYEDNHSDGDLKSGIQKEYKAYLIINEKKYSLDQKKNIVIKDLNLRKRHTFKEVTKEGIAVTSFFFSFPRGTRKLKLRYYPFYGNWGFAP
ncbi:hypothetical protein [Leptospira alstonii]|uniref:Lipoprotein n=2 Tax=Leptospira alstonii TaxID=28452 RepID=M6CGX8_9LEPT|nr:hypothetical protein [Leptospira alstonii]EMJ91157.1 hypothetical protein LEP1GSC194_3424 [Leptospira alstonii serovar Sichuan str. 79601]EQA80580.1 hypothetical protein LEP1GSC193_3288 [Leptospira alstonii serovar Pingchang str. 80-412]